MLKALFVGFCAFLAGSVIGIARAATPDRMAPPVKSSALPPSSPISASR